MIGSHFSGGHSYVGSAPEAVVSRPPSDIDYSSMEFWPLWEAETQQLEEMGFTDKHTILPLLSQYMVTPVSQMPESNGIPDQANMRRVIDALINQPALNHGSI